MLFFPEARRRIAGCARGADAASPMQGTRSATGKMAEFKKGACTVAAKEGAAVVPITLDGTGRLMRNGARACAAAPPLPR